MLTDDLQHQIGSMLRTQSKLLLEDQATTADIFYTERSGRLAASFQKTPDITGGRVVLNYPKYIRFLDMKKTRLGRKKKVYAPIYNRLVYGYLVSGIRRWLIAAGQKSVAKMINDTFTDIRK